MALALVYIDSVDAVNRDKRWKVGRQTVARVSLSSSELL